MNPHLHLPVVITAPSIATELGGVVLSPQPAGPGDAKLKPGACSRPFFGVEPVLTDQKVVCSLRYILQCHAFKYCNTTFSKRGQNSLKSVSRDCCVCGIQSQEWAEEL